MRHAFGTLLILGLCGLPWCVRSQTNEFRWEPGSSGFLWHSTANWIGPSGHIPDDANDRARFDTQPTDNHPLVDRDIAGNIGGGLGQLVFATAGWRIRNQDGTTNTFYFNSVEYFSGLSILSMGAGVNTLDLGVSFLRPEQTILTASGSTLVIAQGFRGGYAPVIDSLDPLAADTGAVRLDAPSRMVSGSFYLRQGTLLVRHSEALSGTSINIGGDASVVDGATARLLTDLGGVVISQDIVVRAYAGHQVNATLGGNQTMGSSTFSGLVTLYRDAQLTSANVDGGAVNFNNQITGPAGIIKVGPGTVALNAANSYGGTTIVREGALRLEASGALPSGTAVVLSNTPGATLHLSRSQQTVDSLWGGGPSGGTVVLDQATLTVSSGEFAGVIEGNGNLVKSGAGTFLLGGTNLYTGLTTIRGGILRLGAANTLASSAGVLLDNAPGAFLDLNNHSQALNVLAGGGPGGGDVLLGTATLTVGSGDFAGRIFGSGGLVKVGSGTLTLAGTNSYTGPTVIQEGVLRMGAAHVLPSSTAITLADAVGTALDLNGFSQEVASIHGGGDAGGNVILGAATLTVAAGDYAGAISGLGDLVKRGPGTLTLRGPNAYSGLTFIEGGTLRLGAPYSLPSGTAVVLGSSPDVVLDLNGHDQLLGSIHGGGPTGGLVSLGAATLTVGSGEFSGVMTGTGGLTKVGPGTLRLHGRNTYAGPTTVLEGTLTYGSDDALGDGPLIVRGVNTLVQMESFSDTVGGVVLAEGGRIEGTGTLTSTSGFDLRSGTVRVNLAGPAGLVKTTMGIVSLAGSNSFTGDTRLMEGVLRIENPAALRLSTVDLKVGDKGGLEFAIPGPPEAIFGGLKGERDLSLPPQTQLSVGNNGASTEYSGRLSGNEVTLYKEGTGTWTLTGNNTVQGTTVIRSGTLQVGSGGSQGWLPTPVMVHSNATLAFHRRDDVRFEFPIAGDGGLVKRGAGVLTLAAPLNEYHGPTTVEEGTLFVEGRHAGGGTYRVGGFGFPAVLAGSGIIEATVLVEPGAALSPGLSSLATLTIQGDVQLAGVLRIDLDGTGHGFADMLSVLGTLTLGPAATLEIQEWTPIDDEAYVFATYESLWGRFVDVSGLPPGYMIDYEYHGTRQIAVVVPEPGAVSLTGLGLLAGAFMARTRHRHAVRRGM